MKTKQPKVTVAISAYNEEKNILPFLQSVLMQKEDGYTLEAIWVYLDGVTDRTAELISNLKSGKIKVFFRSQRELVNPAILTRFILACVAISWYNQTPT